MSIDYLIHESSMRLNESFRLTRAVEGTVIAAIIPKSSAYFSGTTSFEEADRPTIALNPAHRQVAFKLPLFTNHPATSATATKHSAQ